jgi:5-formyltetrahydrofolate cyclo-ligase
VIGKPALRGALRLARRALVAELGPEGVAAAAAALADRLLGRLDGGAMVAGYRATGGELPLDRLFAALALRGSPLALPASVGRAGPVHFRRWSPGDPLEPGPFGVGQPTSTAAEVRPDVVLTPLLGFTRMGHRLGQGAGWYDRAFAMLPGARRIGIGLSMQEVEALPVDPWDVPLHAIATEREWIEVGP